MTCQTVYNLLNAWQMRTLRRRLSQGARARAQEFDWESKGQRLAELYCEAVAQAVEAPGRHPSDFEG